MKKFEQSLYVKKSKKRESQTDNSKYDIIKKHHKFLRESDSEYQSQNGNEVKITKKLNEKQKKQAKEEKVAKEYYDSLYKQYAIVDLSRYQTGQIGCRWRTQKEVIKNKGQRLCAALKCNKQSTNVYEMNFGYVEQGIKKNALVKVSVCEQCAIKLNHSKKLKQLFKKVKIQE